MKKNKFDLLLILKKLKKNKSLMSLSKLNEEKTRVSAVENTLNEMLKSSDFSENEITSSALMKHTSNYKKLLQERLSVSSNRKNYLDSEISENIQQISRINKQKDKIEQKINLIQKDKIELKDKRSEVTTLNKPNV